MARAVYTQSFLAWPLYQPGPGTDYITWSPPDSTNTYVLRDVDFSGAILTPGSGLDSADVFLFTGDIVFPIKKFVKLVGVLGSDVPQPIQMHWEGRLVIPADWSLMAKFESNTGTVIEGGVMATGYVLTPT